MDGSDPDAPVSLSLNLPEEASEKHRLRWTPEEDEHLKSLVLHLGTCRWDMIASSLPGRSELECKFRYNRFLDPDMVKGFWTKEEDTMLIELVSRFGNHKWTRIAKYLKGRRGKQCRERWLNHLNPAVSKNAWTMEEDLLICKAHRAMGTSWSKISRLLPGRTDNSVKNRWYSSLRHRLATGALVLDDDPLPPKQLDTASAKDDRVSPPVENKEDDSGDSSLASLPDAPEEISDGSCYSETPALPLSLTVHDQELFCDVVVWDSDPLQMFPEEDDEIESVRVSRRRRKAEAAGADAVLRMLAEDMLPLSLPEGRGFRSFVAALWPRRPKLSRRSLGLRLYDAVERDAKPRLIRQLRGAEAAGVHVTVDVWPGADPALVVRLHFLDESWRVRRPTVAFRRLSGPDFGGPVTRELEAVLLSYGLFPENVGYVLAHNAKRTVAAHDLLGDYRAARDPEDHELMEFLDERVQADVVPETLPGTRLDCTSTLLQAVLKEALASCGEAEQALAELRAVVQFFRGNAHLGELLQRQCGSSLSGGSALAGVRTLTTEGAWGAARDLLSHARAGGEDPDVPPFPPDRERAADLVGLLEPFEEAARVLQGDGVTFSLVVPCVVGIDRCLAAMATGHASLRQALRAGLRRRFQPLVFSRNLVLATVLDPRVKLRPFGDGDPASCSLAPPVAPQARAVLESALTHVHTWVPVEQGGAAPDREDRLAAHAASLGGVHIKKVFRLEPPPTPGSELDRYLAEPPLDGGDSVEVFWKEATRFPRLRSLSHHLLAVPASSGGGARLYPLAETILRARRNGLPQHTAERLLMYREWGQASP